jgi:hypothetical protein
MNNQQQDAPPSAGSHDTFASAVEDQERDAGSPNSAVSTTNPRSLFDQLPPLPRYLTANASIALSLDHVAAEEEDAGAGDDDDSVESADEANELTESMIEANLERLEDLDDCAEFSEANAIKDLKDIASVPKPPPEYIPPPVKTEKGEPKWEEVDNPGDWSRYCFTPSFNKSGTYISHSLPTGAVPVPLENGVRQCNGWTFLYKDWKMQDHWKSDGLFAPFVGGIDVPSYRSGATQHDISPVDRQSRLNYKLLKELGLTKRRLLVHDPLFFYQLLLPICRTDRSDIPNDPRKSYYLGGHEVDSKLCTRYWSWWIVWTQL